MEWETKGILYSLHILINLNVSSLLQYAIVVIDQGRVARYKRSLLGINIAI